MDTEDSKIFKKAVVLAFTEAAKYMQKKMSMDNKLLQCPSALDPKCHGVDVASRMIGLVISQNHKGRRTG